jgi:hypothetical protein
MGIDTVTIKVWQETRKFLRLISAMTGETILEVAHRIAVAEWGRVQNDKSTQDQTESDN